MAKEQANSKKKEQKKTSQNKKIAENKPKKPRRSYKKELEVVQQDLDKIKEHYVRILAEFENYKKRTDRDFLTRVERANISLIEELLPILDDLERSFNSNNHKKVDKSFYEGVELVYNKFKSTLERLGLEPIETIGKSFNPELHEAILQIEAKDKPSEVIVNEAVKGYKFKDTVIRYSKVVVSK